MSNNDLMIFKKLRKFFEIYCAEYRTFVKPCDTIPWHFWAPPDNFSLKHWNNLIFTFKMTFFSKFYDGGELGALWLFFTRKAHAAGSRIFAEIILSESK